MSFVIRPAVIEDIPFILQGCQIIEQKSYDVAPKPMTAKRIRDEIFCDAPKGFVIVAEFEDQPAAFMVYSYCFFASEGEGIWVTNFYIDPFCRKNGVGKLMLDELKKRNPDTSGIYGAIARSNTIARHFFSGLGATRYEDYTIYGFENDWGQEA